MNKFHKIPTGGGALFRDWAPCTRGRWPLWVEWLYTTAVRVICRLWSVRTRATDRNGELLILDSSQALSLYGVTTECRAMDGTDTGEWPCLGIHAQVSRVGNGIKVPSRSLPAALRYIIRILPATTTIQTTAVLCTTTWPFARNRTTLKGGVA